MNKQNPKELSYHYHPYDIIAWLDTDPDESEIQYDERNKRSIPWKVMKAKLDKLCPENWDIKNFHVNFFFTNDRKHWCSGHIDLVVSYAYELDDGSGVRQVNRTLSGAATFCTEDYAPNTHWAATVKSLAICNAAQPLGKQFGWELNPDEEDQPNEDSFTSAIDSLKKKTGISPSGRTTHLLIPDKTIRTKYAQAIASGNVPETNRLESMYDFSIPTNNNA